MNQKDALTILVQRHYGEFKNAINMHIGLTGESKTLARKAVVKLIANKYQAEYQHLRGKM